MKVRAGTLLQSGKYAIETTLGQGHCGTTYRATHAQLWQPVVIKTLGETLQSHPDRSEFARRFVEQARTLARCHHPNLPRVLDLFEEDGQPFVVMDYIPGSTLAQLLSDNKPIAVDRALHYVRQLASALETLHQNGLLHRDVKPENAIRYVGSDRVVLVEVGLTRDLTAEIDLTHSKQLSPGYAAPEQYDLDRPRTPATDVYALAATLYALLGGQPPVIAPLRERIPLTDLRQIHSDLDPAIERAIAKGLELNPQQRADSISEWLSLLPDATTPPTTTPAKSKKTQTRPSAATASHPRPVFARPWVPALFVTTSIVAAVGGAGFVVTLRSALSERPEVPPSQLLQSTPRRNDFLPSNPDTFDRPFHDPDSWTQRDRDHETEYSHHNWQPDSVLEPASEPSPSWTPSEPAPYYSHESEAVPVQTDKSEPEPVLSDDSFTETTPDAPPVWSEPEPDSMEYQPPADAEELKPVVPARPEPLPDLPAEKEQLAPFKDLSSAIAS
ncbi:MAG: protein kinase [Cyanobacteria bacterium SID2]|nr:protein kinase [Cyanobacteria bacterium SID2]MBP0004538.1 protein kinase [Cyanobacteria bacterium SBC]